MVVFTWEEQSSRSRYRAKFLMVHGTYRGGSKVHATLLRFSFTILQRAPINYREIFNDIDNNCNRANYEYSSRTKYSALRLRTYKRTDTFCGDVEKSSAVSQFFVSTCNPRARNSHDGEARHFTMRIRRRSNGACLIATRSDREGVCSGKVL